MTETAPVVTVKPLKWPDEIRRGRRVQSKGGLLVYSIAHYGGSEPDSGVVYRWAAPAGAWSEAFFSYQHAISAAQADYAARILSALSPAAEREREARATGDLVKDAETMQCCNPGIDVRIGALLDENAALRAAREKAEAERDEARAERDAAGEQASAMLAERVLVMASVPTRFLANSLADSVYNLRAGALRAEAAEASLAALRQRVREVLGPFASFAALPTFDRLPPDMPMTNGSRMAAKQVTVADFRAARALLDDIGGGND